MEIDVAVWAPLTTTWTLAKPTALFPAFPSNTLSSEISLAYVCFQYPFAFVLFIVFYRNVTDQKSKKLDSAGTKLTHPKYETPSWRSSPDQAGQQLNLQYAFGGSTILHFSDWQLGYCYFQLYPRAFPYSRKPSEFRFD